MYARIRLLVLALVTVAAVPAFADAQQARTRRPANSGGPRIERTATAVRNVVQPATDSTAMQRRRQNVGKPVALMIVGGAAILVGAVIGGDAGTLFMIGGAVALLIGLYQYLQ